MNFDSKNILLTGGSGTLGSELIKSKLFDNILTPSKKVLNITKPNSIDKYLCNNDIDCVIHAAGFTKMVLCEEKPEKAIKINIIGTSNLVSSIINLEEQKQKKVKFIYISTDGVYNCKTGNYSEKSATLPYNNYGWSKLGAECAVRLLYNHVIIRTRFFIPNNIPFEHSATDIFTSSLPINELLSAIHFIHKINFIGTINIGSNRMSEFERYKKHKLSLKPCKRQDITKNLDYEIAKDASMNCNLWNELKDK